MPCYRPLPAWQWPDGGEIFFTGRPPTSVAHEFLRLPCGNCIGCRKSRAREWAVRCTLEAASHQHMCWATLTYDDDHLPPTLQKRDLSGYLKRLRAWLPDTQVRFFGSGEYGEKNGRPHYHVILYGLQREEEAIRRSWCDRQGRPIGHVRVDPLTPAAINYVAGYTAKKLGKPVRTSTVEMVDTSTGEVRDVQWQDAFVLMSRRPGIGADARQFWQSWKESAIHNGSPVPVPRYLHQAWRNNTSEQQHQNLKKEKQRKLLQNLENLTYERLRDAEEIAHAKHEQTKERRGL